jgi:peptidylprolyl isomerase
MAGVISNSTPADWRPLDPENTIYVDLKKGRVVIELAPSFAPNTVANVKALVRDGYYEGIRINRVQDNRVVAWEFPDADVTNAARRIKHGKSTLPPEFERTIDQAMPFTPLPDGDVYAPEVGFCGDFPAARDTNTDRIWLIHEYGMVGVGRDNAVDSGGGTELYVIIGQAPRDLDRNVTLIGRVVQGIDLLSSLPRGTGAMGYYEKPGQYVKIKAIRVAADLPPARRTNLEVMRTDTPAFHDLIESRRYRREEWFHVPTGRIEIVNIPIPVRPAARVPAH